MAKLQKAGSGRMYSWWWDSHISPKNSKWLKENLSDMDIIVKQMIKLLEGDGDSFARKAEMYYKKRPELMKLVEEFYRAYRALAERYDYATGALRQAHRTMTEAFPNQIPFGLSDEPITPTGAEVHIPGHALLDSDDILQRGAIGALTNSHATKRHGSYSDEVDRLMSRREQKQFNELSASPDKVNQGRVRKGLNFQDDEEEASEPESRTDLQDQKHEPRGQDDVRKETQYLQEEISRLEKINQSSQLELDTLGKKHHELTSQIEMLNSNVESLQAMIKELQSGNEELKVISKKHEEEKVVLFGSLKDMGKIKEQNGYLENSLSDTHVELEGLRDKIKELEEISGSLNKDISVHTSEKAVLASQVEAISQNVEKLSEKNMFLENSLSDATVEIESLRGKLKIIEQSHQSLDVQRSNLLCEKNTLSSQIEGISQTLKNLETGHAELEDKHLILERENGSNLQQIIELQHVSKLEKQEHENFVRSSKNEQDKLENQIRLLMEESQIREEELQLEQQKIIAAEMAAFILQKCLCDMKERNSVLSTECLTHIETIKCIEQKISEAKQTHLLQEDNISLLSAQCEKLRDGFQLMVKELNLKKDSGLLGRIDDELLLQVTLREISAILSSIADIKDENQRLNLELSVTATLLKQFGTDIADLRLEKDVLEKEAKAKGEELLVMQRRNLELQEMNVEIKEDLQSSKQREDTLKAEIEGMCSQVSVLQESYCSLQSEQSELLEDKQILSKELSEMRDTKNTVLLEALTLDHLYLIFQSFNSERARELIKYDGDLCGLVGAKKDLEQEIELMKEKVSALEAENSNLKQSILNLKVCRSRLLVLEGDLETTKSLVSTLSEDNAQKKNEIESLHQTKETLNSELEKLIEEVKQLKDKEEHLTSELHKGVAEVNCCEVEIATLLNDIQVTAVNAAVFEDKVIDLLMAYERLGMSSMVEREMLRREIISRDAYLDELWGQLEALLQDNRRMKTDLSAYSSLVTSLWCSMESLEECILSFEKHYTLDNQRLQDNLSVSYHHDEGNNEPSEDHSNTLPKGVLDLQRLHVKMEALQKFVIVAGNRLEEQMSEEIIVPLEKGDDNYADLSNADSGQTMRDIQLDQNSPYENAMSSYKISAAENPGADEHMLELWEKAETDSIHQEQQDSTVKAEIKEIGKEHKYSSSGLVFEKELSMDRLESPNKVRESSQDWNQRVIERLASDAERLSLLQTSVKELKEKMDATEKNSYHKNPKLDAVKAQLKQTEGAILEMIYMNSQLMKKAEDFPQSFDSFSGEQKQIGNTSKRQISVSSRRGSQRIGRLEQELEELHYILLKFNEERDSFRIKVAGRRRRVVLRDYLYGRKRQTNKFPICGCSRPRTLE